MGGRKWPWVVFAAFVLVAAGLTLSFSLVGDDGGPEDGSDPQSSESTVKEDLLEQVRPRPSCPISEPGRAPGKDEKMVAYATVEDDCLVFTAEVVPVDEAEARVAELRARDDVVSADVEKPVEPAGPAERTTGAPPEVPWQYAQLQGDEIERRWPPDAPEVTVAVIDTGINQTDPAFAGTAIKKRPKTQAARHKEDEHGTAVAGLIAASRLDRAMGLTPRVRLLDAQLIVYYPDKVDPWREVEGRQKEEKGVYEPPSHPIPFGDLITWSVNEDTDVINISLSILKPDANVEAALKLAQLNGVVSVAGAGNCHVNLDANHCYKKDELKYPASYEELVLSVAAIDEHEERASYSSVNGSVDIAAPGHLVPTRCLDRDDRDDLRPVTCDFTGTSAATPMVAAAAAFLTAVVPEASPAEIKTALIETAHCPRALPHEKCQPRSEAFGSGIVQPVAAAEYLLRNSSSLEDPANDVVAAYTAQDPLTRVGAQESPPTEAQEPPPTEAFLQLRDGSRVKFRKIAVPPSRGDADADIDLAFSPDGAIAAATDGRHLTVVEMEEGYPQHTVGCNCSGLAFRPADQVLVTWREGEEGRASGGVPPPDARDPSNLTLFDVSSGDPREKESFPVKRGAAVLDYGTVLGADDHRVYAFVQDPRSLEVAGDVVAIAYGGGLATPIASAPYGVSEFAISADGRYLAYPANDDCISGSEVSLVDLRSINYSAPNPDALLRDLGNPGGTGINLVSLRFEGNDLLAGWAQPEPGGTVCQDFQAPDLYRAEVARSSGTSPRWRRVETGVAWQASIESFGELALKGVGSGVATRERFVLSVRDSDAPPRTLAREVDQVLLRPSNPPPTRLSDEFAGLWEGQVSQPGARPPTYTIKLRLTVGNGSEIAGTFDFPELDCGGRIEFMSLLGRELTFTDIITYGKSNCVSGGSVRFLLDSGSLDRAHRTWKAMWHGELLTSTATLRKAP